uniref:3 Finger toxin B n=1 Tax=Echis coloratus TaxID=64175 RepID=A0A0A1WCI9_ECHCO
MKTLLLMLGVVAFVYLEPGYTLVCKSCPDWKCALTPGVECSNDSTQCYKKLLESGGLFPKYERGCATNCTTVTGKEKVTYCATDNCND